MAHWDQHGFGLWALRTRDGAFAGRAGIRHIIVDGVDEVEIAYTLKRSLWGQGLASEIAIALTDIGLSQLKLPSLIGLAFVENAADPPRPGEIELRPGKEHDTSRRTRGDLPYFAESVARNRPRQVLGRPSLTWHVKVCE